MRSDVIVRLLQVRTELPTPGVTASAYDDVREDLYLVYQDHIFLFPDLTMMPVITPSAYFSLAGYDITGLHVLPGAATNQALFRAYLSM